MRICRFAGGYGLVDGTEVIDISAYVSCGPDGNHPGDPLIRSLAKLRGLDPDTLGKGNRRRLADVQMLSPVRSPSKILAAPNNYRDHSAEMQADTAVNFGRMATLDEAGFFLKANTSLVGPSEGIALRFPDRRTDHEVELVIVIGDAVTRPIEAPDAMAFVAGYALGLDITLRGPEERSLRKSIDTYTVLGPWLVTRDEVQDPATIGMRLSINGELRQSTVLSEMIFSVAEQIAYASRFYALYPGDLIYTGTPAGVGPIRPGDVIHAEADMLGHMDVAVRLADT